MIGPGKAFDTDKYFVICSNVLGGCMGTTGPSSVNPRTGKPYGLDFPIISIPDMVNVQKHLIDHLEIDRLLSVAGGSMGGMQALEWLTAHPGRLNSGVVIATATKHSPSRLHFMKSDGKQLWRTPFGKTVTTTAGIPRPKARRRPYDRPYHLYERSLDGREIRKAPE